MLDALRFDNRFTRELPGDPEAANFRRQVLGACYSRVLPTPVAAPKLVAYSPEVAALLDLTPAACDTPLFTEVFSGNRVLRSMDPFAMCYGGHQFGNWAGQLGDGRAIELGEVLNQRDQRWALQLKGAGPTPYSRTADGLAVLRSSVREFLCSEAMHHLGVPTTRALSLVTTGEEVVRDMFYNGNPRPEPGAIVCRVAPSFIRFGNFEILAARGDVELLRRFVDYTITTAFPELGAPNQATYLAWFEEVCRRTAIMIVHWMRVGFVHGVMNTDNMSILGLTIDYGPYGWLENYDPDWTPNTTDAQGRRYRYGAQPEIALWNLVQLANAIYPLIGEVPPLQAALTIYSATFEAEWRKMMAGKLGLIEFNGEADANLVAELLAVLQLTETDMPIFFRALADPAIHASAGDQALTAAVAGAYYRPETVTPEITTQTIAWLRRYLARLAQDGREDLERQLAMNRVNPKYVLRNYLAQLAIDKCEQGENSLVLELLDVLRRPYDEQPARTQYAQKRPDWARQRAGCSMLSCSS
ncbi:MAG: YdiU family protein [Gammaproteobacteria bacterium]|nr:YdiU family protein [Gammaproteobacteria bacterium]